MTTSETILQIIAIAFGIIVILGPVIIAIWAMYETISNSKEREIEEYRGLYQFVKEEYSQFLKNNKDLVEPKALSKFFSNKSMYEKAIHLKQHKEFEYEHYYLYSNMNKEELKWKRQFSYKYERVIYDIFSPYGIYISDNKWLLNTKLTDSYIIGTIGERLYLNLIESIKLFDKFIEYGLIQETRPNEKFYVMGYVLYYWDCVSINDWSFSKWMTDKLYHHSIYSEFNDFIKEYGIYDIINENNCWIVRFYESGIHIIDIKILDQKIIDLIYSNNNKKTRTYDWEFGHNNSDETKQLILKMIEECSRFLYVDLGFELHYNIIKNSEKPHG